MRERERVSLQNVQYQNALIDQEIPGALDDFKQRVRDLDFVYDLNDCIKDSKESLFTKNFIHCNTRGNAIVAEAVFKTLQEKGMIR